MAPPPAKRQKRSVVLSSDDEGTAGTEQSKKLLPTRLRSKQTSTIPNPRTTPSSASSPSSSPAKPRREGNAGKKNSKPGTLYSFFNAATQTQRVSGKPGSESRKVDNEEEDLIQDDSFDEGILQVSDLHRQEELAPYRHKNPGKAMAVRDSTACKEVHPNASQRFLTKDKSILTPSNNHSVATPKTEDLRPWSEKYAPVNLGELAVHKKKVADVRFWLDNAFHGPDRKRLLVLKGPSGTGKTATISALAKAMSFDISEWKNPNSQDFSSEGFQSMSAQFEEFLGRSGKFGRLEFDDAEINTTRESPLQDEFEIGDTRNKITLLEEFPNTYTRTSSALQSFRSSILQYLASNTPFLGALYGKQEDTFITPLVMIISETLLTSTTAAADSFTAHRLLGPDILNHPAVTVIEFNPIAATFLTKALNLVIQKEARHSGRRRTPGSALLKRLGEVGDIRSAIGSLEFLCIRGDTGGDWSGRVASKTKSCAKNGHSLTKMEKESIEMVTQREASLGIFHAVGKVIYNKRDDMPAADPSIEPPSQPPDHLSHHVRAKISQVSVDQLIDEIGTDTQTFIAALHENYVLSCDCPDSTNAINGCIDTLSDSDLLSSGRGSGFTSGGLGGGFGRGACQGGGSDSMRQDELCFQVAVRGILFSLPCPVKRQAMLPKHGSRGSGKGDAYKIFYPTSLRLWKQIEEIESLVDLWTDSSMTSLGVDGLQSEGNLGRRHAQGSVETWNNKSSASGFSNTATSKTDEETSLPLLINSNSARTQMVLERLPYVAKIERGSPDLIRTQGLERITQFHGISTPNENLPDDEEDGIAIAITTEWTMDGPIEYRTSKSQDRNPETKNDNKKNRHGFGGIVPVERAVEKLVLTEDDIED